MMRMGLCLFFFLVSLPLLADINVRDLINDDLRTTNMVRFQQSASSGTDATSVSKITLAYFTSSNCTGSLGGSGFYTTPNGTSFAISIGTSFGLGAASAWNVGSTQLSIADMTTIQSVAVTFKSTNNNTPQSSFTGVSYACIPVTCAGGECTSASGTQGFTLKTTAAVGDPADGGVIACLNGGLNDLVVPSSDNNSGTILSWASVGTTSSATSTTDGSANTTAIVNNIGASGPAPRLCALYSAGGGYTSGWFLPAGHNATSSGQLNCLYTNKTAIGGFGLSTYWSSTESGTSAYRQSFNTGAESSVTKTGTAKVRCARALVP